MNIVYFQPPDINPKYCEVGYLVENDPGYIYYAEEPCKILKSEVTIIDMERVIHDKNLGVYKLKPVEKTGKTGVEWLIEQINPYGVSVHQDLFEQAKEIETQARIDAFDDGYQQGVQSMVCTNQNKEFDGVDDGREYVKVQDWSEMRTRTIYWKEEE